MSGWKFLIIILFMANIAALANDIPVTFRVKMGERVKTGAFNPANDSITVIGDFQCLCADFSNNWDTFKYKMTGNSADTIYSVKVYIPTKYNGRVFQFIFEIGPAKGETCAIRKFTLANDAMVLPSYWFNNDSTYISIGPVINTFKFTADLSKILGTGKGYFDPNKDSLLVQNLDWYTPEKVVGGSLKMVQDSISKGLYTTSITLRGTFLDSCMWRFMAMPANKFDNYGIESGVLRYFKFWTDGSVVDLGVIEPVITPLNPPLKSDLSVLFECNLTTESSIINAKNGRSIPVDSILWVGLKGNIDALGNWGGAWQDSDTSLPNPTMVKLLDDGTNGDSVAGDKIFSAKVIFPAGTLTQSFEYNFGIWYPSVWNDAGGSTPMDNESLTEKHLGYVGNSAPTEYSSLFGVFPSYFSEAYNDSKIVNNFQLFQNFPNPFNPETKISFFVPVDGVVVLKVYNALGQEINTLINGYVKAGRWQVTFNASSFPSGIYLYSIRAGNYLSTKKMVMLK